MKKICTAFISACLGCIPLQAENTYLHSGTPSVTWKVKPQAEVGNDVSRLSDPRYDMSSWVDAVVPGTVFNSYVVAGYEEDPNFGDNIHRADRTGPNLQSLPTIKKNWSGYISTESTAKPTYTSMGLCWGR